ncbi:TPA: DUF3173 family protein, partial [Streptococcus suis]|nr:DUF3173 family protein [Streptococcus suis]HEM3640932.1 DUF3173 family protein [Streptococcus suis]
METITHKNIMKLGFSKTASKLIIREAKAIAVEQFYTSHLDNNAVNVNPNVMETTFVPIFWFKSVQIFTHSMSSISLRHQHLAG